MAKINLNPASEALAQARTSEGKKAISQYIQLASRIIVEYGQDTDIWPQDILQELLQAGRAAYEADKLAARVQKARDTGGVTLADF